MRHSDLERELNDLRDELCLDEQYEAYKTQFEEDEDEDDEPRDFDDWLHAQDDDDCKKYINAVEELEQFPRDEQLIREDCFENYMREYVENVCSIEDWLKMYIDFARLASDASSDYTCGDFLGTTYLWRE